MNEWTLYKSKKHQFAMMARELDDKTMEVVYVKWDEKRGAWVPTVWGP